MKTLVPFTLAVAAVAGAGAAVVIGQSGPPNGTCFGAGGKVVAGRTVWNDRLPKLTLTERFCVTRKTTTQTVLLFTARPVTAPAGPTR